MTDRPPSVDGARRALERAERATAQQPDEPGLQRELVRAWVTQSQAFLADFRFGEADQAAERALEIAVRLTATADDGTPIPGNRVAAGLAGLQRGVTLLELLHAARREDHTAPDRVPDHLPPEPADAIRPLRAAIEALDQVPAGSPEASLALPMLSSAHGSLAVAIEADGHLDDAFPHLHAALRYAERHAEASPADLRAKAALALAHNALGHHYAATDRHRDAGSHHEQSLERNAELVAADPGNNHWRFCLATDHENLCDLFMRQGEPAAALGHAQACAIERARLAQDPDAPREWRDQQADALRDVAEISFETGNVEVGFDAYGQMLSVLRELAEEPPVLDDALFRYADGLLVLGYACEEQLRWKDALQAFETALEVDRRLIERQPEELRWHANAAHCHLCIALARLELDDPDGSDAAAADGRRILDSQLRRKPGDVGLLRDLSHFSTELAAAHARRDLVERALEEYQAAEATEQQLARLDDADHATQASLASIHDNLAALCERRGDLDAALRHGQQAVRHEERLVQLDPESVPYQSGLVRALLNLANTSLGRGAPDRALRTLRRATSLAVRLGRLVPDDDEVSALSAQVDRATGEAHRDLGDTARAEQHLSNAARRLRKLIAEAPHAEIWLQPAAESLEALAEFRIDQDDAETAVAELQEACDLRRRSIERSPEEPAAHRELARTEETLADALEATGNFAEASRHRQVAQELFDRYGED